MTIKNASVFTKCGRFQTQDIYVEGERFAQASSDLAVIDAQGCLLIPGLIDIHFHGCAGYDFCDATTEALNGMAEYELQNGITSICPTSMAQTKEALTCICKNAVAYHHAWKPGHTSRLCGIHLEGPFISIEKRGAQNPAYITAPDIDTLEHIFDNADGLIKLITIAPETQNALELIKRFAPFVRISIGHTACDYETASNAFLAGASHMTHLFNAMTPFTHRSPGPIGAGFDHPHVTAEIICDGVHTAPTAVRVAFALFGDDRMLLVSDSMRATGMPDGNYSLGGLDVHVQGVRAVLADGTLAGSVTNLLDCMRIAVKEMKIPLESAIKAVTINPARAIGEDREYGSIEIGKYADFLLLDAGTLELKKVFSHGMAVAL